MRRKEMASLEYLSPKWRFMELSTLMEELDAGPFSQTPRDQDMIDFLVL